MEEAKKYYPLFGLGANVALIFSGLYVRFVSGLQRASTAADPWAGSLRMLMAGVSGAGAMVLLLYRWGLEGAGGVRGAWCCCGGDAR